MTIEMCHTENGLRGKIYVYFVAYSLNWVSFVLAITFAWASPGIPRLDGTIEPDLNPLSPPVSLSEGSWLAAVIFLGAILGNVVTIFAVPFLGKRKTLMLTILPTIFAFLTFAFCKNLPAFFIARVCCGVTLGATLQILPIYLGEIISKDIRGAVSCCFAINIAIGQLYVYIIGPLMTFQAFNQLNVLFPLSSFLLVLLFVDESPYHFVALGDHAAARRVLTKLRPGTTTKDIEEELDEIVAAIERKHEELSLRELLASRPLCRSLVISSGLMVSVQLAIINPVISYMETIFTAAGASAVDPQTSAVYVALLQLVSICTIPFIVDRFGRKILLVGGQVMVTVAIASLGAYFFVKERTDRDVEAIAWLPLASLIIYIVAFAMGVGSITYIVCGEIFPENAKNMASMVSVLMSNTFAFCILFVYPLIEDQIGAGYTFWIFAVICALSVAFIVVLVPETKGKSLAEIQLILEKK